MVFFYIFPWTGRSTYEINIGLQILCDRSFYHENVNWMSWSFSVSQIMIIIAKFGKNIDHLLAIAMFLVFMSLLIPTFTTQFGFMQWIFESRCTCMWYIHQINNNNYYYQSENDRKLDDLLCMLENSEFCTVSPYFLSLFLSFRFAVSINIDIRHLQVKRPYAPVNLSHVNLFLSI